MLRILLIAAFAAVLLLASCVKDIQGDEEFTGAVKSSSSPVAIDAETHPAAVPADEAEGGELATVGDEAAEDVEGVGAEGEDEAVEAGDEDVDEDVNEDVDESGGANDDEDDDADDGDDENDTEEATG
ncbi:hypothetical protein J7J84_07570 [bacterium]|nr:hypothetical protein [bacterium]